MKLSRKIFIIMAAMGVFIGTAYAQKKSKRKVEVVPAQEFNSRLHLDKDAYLLDVRTNAEFVAGHLKGSHQLDWLDSTSFNNGANQLDKTKTIYVYCRSGHRSNMAAHNLAAKGFNVVDLQGGYISWTANKLEIEK